MIHRLVDDMEALARRVTRAQERRAVVRRQREIKRANQPTTYHRAFDPTQGKRVWVQQPNDDTEEGNVA